MNAHEIKAGTVYKDAKISVTAFPTKHAMPQTFGYRFDTPDRSIVISGDTAPTQALIDACHGCDILVHEVHTMESLAKRPESFQAFAAKYHTNTAQLAELAAKARPKLFDTLAQHHQRGALASASLIRPPTSCKRRWDPAILEDS